MCLLNFLRLHFNELAIGRDGHLEDLIHQSALNALTQPLLIFSRMLFTTQEGSLTFAIVTLICL